MAALEPRSCEPVIGVDKMHYANIAHPHYIWELLYKSWSNSKEPVTLKSNLVKWSTSRDVHGATDYFKEIKGLCAPASAGQQQLMSWEYVV